MASATSGERDISTCVGRLHVRVVGAGPGAVLWHSLFVDSLSWQGVEPALARLRTLVLIDGPSHGGSEPAQHEFSLEDCARAAVEVLVELGIDEPVDWVGNAWGGHVGIVLAASEPGSSAVARRAGEPDELPDTG